MYALLTACVAAWRPGSTTFDLDIPPDWTVTHNARSFGNDHLILSHAPARATIALELVAADAASRRLPLDLLAEGRALSAGRAFGVVNTRSGLHQLDIDGHEAWAVTGTRRWRLVTADYSTVVLRVGARVAILTLQTPMGALDASLPGWSIVLETLNFPRDSIPPDAPLFDVEG